MTGDVVLVTGAAHGLGAATAAKPVLDITPEDFDAVLAVNEVRGNTSKLTSRCGGHFSWRRVTAIAKKPPKPDNKSKVDDGSGTGAVATSVPPSQKIPPFAVDSGYASMLR